MEVSFIYVKSILLGAFCVDFCMDLFCIYSFYNTNKMKKRDIYSQLKRVKT